MLLSSEALFLLLFFCGLSIKSTDAFIKNRFKRSVNYKFNDTVTGELKDYYCRSSYDIVNESEGRIKTRHYRAYFYDNNMFCLWNLNAGPGKRFQIVVESWQLQYAPLQAICVGYDHIKLVDGDWQLSWCQTLPIYESPFYINSRGSKLTVIFESDQSNPRNHKYAGGNLRFRTFDDQGCPPNWISFRDACFTLKNVILTWSDGQKACNMEQANLASIVSQEEFNFLEMSYMGYPGLVWIGLNDKSVYGTFKWIDNSSASGSFDGMSSVKAEPYYHCGYAYFKTGLVRMSDCENEMAVLCRTERGNVSKLYPIPLFKTDKGDERDSRKGRGVLLGVLVPCILTLLAITVGICIYRKRDNLKCLNTTNASRRNPKRHQEGEEAEGHRLEPSAPQEPDSNVPPAPRHIPPPAADPSQYIPPPTYEEALLSNPR